MNDLFQVEDRGGDTVTVRNVPIFKTHQDREYNCDEKYLDRCIATHIADKAESVRAGATEYNAMLPNITIGHTPESDSGLPEPETVGFMDNLRRSGQWLYADLVGLARDVWDKLKKSRFPYRSVEILPKHHRLTNVSLLSRAPHFAQPMMRFTARRPVARYDASSVQDVEVQRYTTRGWIMDQEQIETYFGENQGGSGGGGGGGGGGMGGGMEGGGAALSPQVCQQLCQQLAPMVAKMLTQNQANAPGGPMAHAGAYKNSEGVTFYVHDGKVYRNGALPDGRYTNPEGKVARIAGGKISYDEGKPPVKAGMDDSDEEIPKKETTPALDAKTVSADEDKHAEVDQLKQYIAKLETGLAELKDRNEALGERVQKLQEHNVATNDAARRTMLTSKFKELTATGYAIGDVTQIERHVGRCLRMQTAEEVKEYIDDLKASARRVKMPVDRHGSYDVVRSPGSGDDAERYYAENKEDCDRDGLDVETLRLAEFLG
jgi:hypothetical protein